MKTRRWVPFAVLTALSLSAGYLGTVYTIPSITGWYASLAHPVWTPPNWVFGPVWTTLYILMGIAAGFVWKSDKKGKKTAIALFLVHLLVNAAWSIIFFGFHMIGLGLAVIALLWLLVVVLMYLYAPLSKRAVKLMIPYLLWVTYALTLNLGIMLMNP